MVSKLVAKLPVQLHCHPLLLPAHRRAPLAGPMPLVVVPTELPVWLLPVVLFSFLLLLLSLFSLKEEHGFTEGRFLEHLVLLDQFIF